MEVEYGTLRFVHPGHATVRIETSDQTVLYVDPWREVIDGEPSDADLVFVTHDDRDHFDPEGIASVSNDLTIVIAFEKIDTDALEQETVSLPYDGEFSGNGVEATALPAYNRPNGSHVRDSGKPYHEEGDGIGLMFTVDGTTVYYCGDTDALNELTDADADIVIPPIGGRPTMNRHEAADFVGAIGPDLVLPVHYNSNTISGLSADAEAFKGDVEARGPSVILF